MATNIESIREALERCRAAKPQPNVFGADSHEFNLNDPIDKSIVARFESQHDVALPEDYRRFIIDIGNGGAGPYYGIFRLGEMDNFFKYKRWKENDGFVGNLAKPFPHTEAWNDIAEYPEEQDDEDAYEVELVSFDNFYWNPENINGAIPICHQGCAYRYWLVVTGPEAGYIWEDLRADYKGLMPARLKSGCRASFLEWYKEWLDEAVAKL